MYLLLDIGGTNTRITLSSDGQTLTAIKTFPTEEDFETQIQLISRIAHELTGGQKIEAAAAGVAGILDKEKSLLLKSPHLDSWTYQPLKEELEQVLDCAVYLENDAHLGGLGESVYGAGKGYPIVAYITIGTGVGGVKIENQKIDGYSKGFEPGHQIIIPEGNPCNCGGKGHLETYVAGSYLKEPIDWNKVAKYLAIGLNNTIVHWSPDIIVLGGSVMKSIPLDRVKAYLKKYLTIFSDCPQITLATLGDEGGLYGGLQYLKS
ncbi:ROK family protein [Candidatus Daviesbacteria bacterium]|nr:ROK family protein [Candidatus Daviesbacteria bacterium]